MQTFSLCSWSPLSALHNVGRSGKLEKNLVGLKEIWSRNLIRKVIRGSAPKRPKRCHKVRIHRPTNNLKVVRFRPTHMSHVRHQSHLKEPFDQETFIYQIPVNPTRFCSKLPERPTLCSADNGDQLHRLNYGDVDHNWF